MIKYEDPEFEAFFFSDAPDIAIPIEMFEDTDGRLTITTYHATEAIAVAFEERYTDNPFFVIFLGMTTGCGGGLLRDIFVREVPFILTEKIYAIASIFGGIVYYVMVAVLQLDPFLSVICGITLIFLTRIISSIFHWDLPKAI